MFISFPNLELFFNWFRHKLIKSQRRCELLSSSYGDLGIFALIRFTFEVVGITGQLDCWSLILGTFKKYFLSLIILKR